MTRQRLDIVGHHVREAVKIAPVRPAIWLGLRTAAATAVPLLAAHMIEPAAASWAPLAGFLVALSDKGGAYRSRAKIMGSVAIGGLIAVLLGSLIAGHGIFTSLAVGLCVTVCSLSPAFGPRMDAVGKAFAVQLLIAAALPCSLHDAFERAVGFAGGASFALLLGLVLWPVRVYKPGRRAVAAVLRELAALTDELFDPYKALTFYRSVRDRIEHARTVLAATRHGQHGETSSGERLIAALQLSEQMFGVLVGLHEAIAAGCPPKARALVMQGLDALALDLERIAVDILQVEPPATAMTPWSADVPCEGNVVQRRLAAHALALVARAHHDCGRLAVAIGSLDGTEPLPTVHVVEPDPAPDWHDALRVALDPRGAIARHALRVAVVVCLAMNVARVLDLSHRHWVTVAAYVLMRPLAAATRVRALQRVVGTVLGCVIASMIPGAVDDERIIMAAIVVLAGLSATIERVNYGLFALLVTPAFALLADLHSMEPHLMVVRIENTLLAAMLVIGSSMLWPSRPSIKFDERMADTYDAAADYLEAVLAAIRDEVPYPSPVVLAARRRYGLAANRAEIALDQLASELAEPHIIEPRMTQLAFMRRLGGGITTLTTTRMAARYKDHIVELAAFGGSIAAGLRSLAQHDRNGMRLAARAHVDRIANAPVLSERLERIDGALANLTLAAMRSAPEPALVVR